MQILVSLFVAILIGFDGFEGEFGVIIKPMSLRIRTYVQYNSFSLQNEVLVVKLCDIFLSNFLLKC